MIPQSRVTTSQPGLGTAPLVHRVGLAISASELLLDALR